MNVDATVALPGSCAERTCALLRTATEQNATGVLVFDEFVAGLYVSGGSVRHAILRQEGHIIEGEDALVQTVRGVIPHATDVEWMDLDGLPRETVTMATEAVIRRLSTVIAPRAAAPTAPPVAPASPPSPAPATPAVAAATPPIAAPAAAFTTADLGGRATPDAAPPAAAVRGTKGPDTTPTGDVPAWKLSDIVIVIALGLIAGTVQFPQIQWLQSRGVPVSLATLVMTVGEYILISAVLIGLVRRRGGPLRSIGLVMPRIDWIVYAVPIGIGAILLGGLLTSLEAPFIRDTGGECSVLSAAFGGNVVVAIIAGVVVGPISEEMTARGLLYGWLRPRLPRYAAIGLSALIFALPHAQSYGVGIILPIFSLALIVTVVYEKSGSLIPGAIVHAVFNLYGLVVIAGSSHC